MPSPVEGTGDMTLNRRSENGIFKDWWGRALEWVAVRGFPEANSEMMFSLWIYWRSGAQPLRKGMKQLRHWEKLGCKAVSTKASAGPKWSSEAGMTLHSCLMLQGVFQAFIVSQ